MIESLDNKRVKNWTKLHQKKYRDGDFLLLSEELVLSAYGANCLKTLIYVKTCPFKFDEAYEVSQEVMDKIAKKPNLKCIGVGKRLVMNRDFKNRVIVLDDLADPLNIGRIMESAYLFGFDGVLLSSGSADIYHPKCLAASKGAIFKLNIYRGDLEKELLQLKEWGFKLLATGLRDKTLSLHEVKSSEKMAFVLGNEGSGVRNSTFELCDEIVKIDMHNIDSLNVAMAGAIIMYEFARG